MIRIKYLFTGSLALLLMVIFNCCKSDEMKLAEGVVFPLPEKFETVIDGRQVGLYTLENRNGWRTDITNHGGKIVTLLVPDRDGVFDDIVTGYHSIEEFLVSGEPYFGALIGRYANRIVGQNFRLTDRITRLPQLTRPATWDYTI